MQMPKNRHQHLLFTCMLCCNISKVAISHVTGMYHLYRILTYFAARP